MPGELGNEEEQQGVGYYEHRFSPDVDPCTEPNGTIGDMKKKPPNGSVMRVLRKFTENQMKRDESKQEFL